MNAPATRPNLLLLLLPLALFAALALLFALGLLHGDPSRLPSALVGRPAPQTALPPLAGIARDGIALPGLDPALFKGHVSVVNVWASWCGPCRDEVPLLNELATDRRIQLIGINYKDSAENARRFLSHFGNPYSVIGVDAQGRASIEWGVYGVPETFLVGADGVIAYKLVGQVTAENINGVLKAEIDKAVAKGAQTSSQDRPD
ncbi:MAG: DsbE family thiol:disulfide interchange protein [Alphaproteobacteria bacterium]|nr:DsbE family thiol:disulfide interchange protein [Alphaproteobacteria bacterium]